MKFFILLLFGKCISLFVSPQGVGIGTPVPNASALMDITSTNKGVLIPRMSTATIIAIPNPAKGLLVYDSTKNQLMVNMGSPSAPEWETIVARSGWNLTGNHGTNPATDFIGNIDNQPIIFKINGQRTGYLGTEDLGATFLGYQSGINNGNIWNTGIGAGALRENTGGGINVAVGYNALRSNNNGSANTAVGVDALINNTVGFYNVAVGRSALRANLSDSNVAVGANALFRTSNSKFNTAVGANAASAPSLGWNNTIIGANTATFFTLGWNNTMIGANCRVNQNDLFNCIALGQDVFCNASNQARIGNSATTSIGGYVNWSNISDGRYKKNIQENVKGIDFIMKLRPITYQLDVAGLGNKLNESRGMQINAAMNQAITEKESFIFSGFVAQEVEAVAKQLGYAFSGVDAAKNANDLYSLRYAEFVVPLTKAVQEQQAIITQHQQTISDLQKRLNSLEEQVRALVGAARISAPVSR